MNLRSLKALEYPKIISRLEEKAVTSMGKELAVALLPTTRLDLAELWQSETREGLDLFRFSGGVSLGGVKELRPALKRLEKAGILSVEQLLDIANTIYASRRVKRSLLSFSKPDLISQLLELASTIVDLADLEKAIRSAIDDNGEIKDTASTELNRIRQQINSAESKLKSKLESIIKSPANQSKLQDTIVTIRDGRYVIPVKQEHRMHFGGIVHDQSASGATIYVEPAAIVEINNQLREAMLKEEKEIERILQQLSAKAMVEQELLLINIEALAQIDFIQAKAELAEEMHASKPSLNKEGRLNFKKARHPLIAKGEVVPIDIELGKDYQAIVITGPNTGGKTVSLKTIGLLSLMAMAGLHLPVEEGSVASLYSAIYVDIGDEQSIEQSLSTFSGHMTNIINILAEFDENSLILLDELGAGTDPTEGAALAIALLEYIRNIGASVVATTHYSELKAYAYNSPGVVNASVEFSVETLQPTYRLMIGAPGRSNAFLIAKRLGLDEEIIEVAKQQIDQDDQQVESMIAILETNRSLAERDRIAAEELKKQAAKISSDLEQRLEQFEIERETIYKDAQKEAEEIVAKAKQTAETVINNLRQFALAEQASVKEHRLIDMKKELDAVIPKQKKKRPLNQDNASLEIGDDVQVINFDQRGTILEQLSNEEFLVQIGSVKLKIGRSELSLLPKRADIKPFVATSFKRSDSNVRPEIDLHGYNVEDAIATLDIYLDKAFLQGYSQVTIIHGLGTGKLRAGLQDFLRRHPHTRDMRTGRHGEGGRGVTVITFK